MTFSIIIPCYNETVSEFRKNLAYMDGYFDFKPEFLILENGSEKLYQQFGFNDRRFRYFWRHSRGLGWALKEGIKNASWPFAFFLPADNAYDLSFVRHAMGYLETGYSMVIGSKAVDGSEVRRPMKRKLLSKGYNLALQALYGPGWPSDLTGVKGYRKRDIAPLALQCDSDGIYFEVQLMRKVVNSGLKSKEIAVKVNDMRPSRFNPFTNAEDYQR